MAAMQIQWQYKFGLLLLIVSLPFVLASMLLDSKNAHECHSACVQRGFKDSRFSTDKHKFFDSLGRCYCQSEDAINNKPYLNGEEIRYKTDK